MHVVATAGHVDHGKSTLVRALTGTDPDRLAEEKRRGLTTDLGFAWMPLADTEIAFVDVPGHERFVPTMLAGVGPVPAALLVVAADGGWMPQSSEHLDALDALGVRHGLLVVTRADLAAPAPATAQAREHLAGTSLAGIEAVAVSATTGAGLDDLRAALTRLVGGLPVPDPSAPVRLWVDRAFTVRGAGTVVTGTLPSGTMRTGDRLVLPGGRAVTVRGLQSLGRPVDAVHGVARVAANLRGVALSDVGRGDAVTTPGTHRETSTVDVRLTHRPVTDLPSQCLLHTGSAQVAAHVRPLGSDTARLRLRSPLPLRIGDVGLLRDPGRHLVLGGVTVLDVAPPTLRRRGSGRRRAADLAAMTGHPDAAGELARRRVVHRSDLLAMGVGAAEIDALATGRPEWLVDPRHAERLVERLSEEVHTHLEQHPLETGMPTETLRQHLELPAQSLVDALVRPPLALQGGRVVDTRRRASALPAAVATAVDEIRRELAETPYAAPEAHRLRDLGLGPKELAAAVRAGALAPVAEGVYLTPEALRNALTPLAALPQPFSLSEARQAWETSRRVAVPLLERLDRLGVTERLPDDRRRVRAQTSTSASTRGTSASSSRARKPSGPT